MKKLSLRFAEKSVATMLSALEIYNKPDIKYREELTSILLINAFELLFKAKIVKDNSNNIKSIYVYETRKTKTGKISKRSYIKTNRIQSPFTIDIGNAMNLLIEKGHITNNTKKNINILIELRDNAIHFINKDKQLETKLFSVCAGAVKNYTKLFKLWFPELDLSSYNFFITPLNFSEISELETVNSSVAEKNFLNYIDLELLGVESTDDYDVILNVDIKFTKNITDDAVLVKYAEDGKNITLDLDEETFKKVFPLEHSAVIKKIKQKVPNFKQDRKFNLIKKDMHERGIFCRARYLNLNKKTGAMKYYYNSNFIDRIIEEYNKKR